ncbi:hypothetical protein HDE_02766 [Halotydeus destructor]|nr:hypothetical protein HDE_02766 [Halotydeus destructor]
MRKFAVFCVFACCIAVSSALNSLTDLALKRIEKGKRPRVIQVPVYRSTSPHMYASVKYPVFVPITVERPPESYYPVRDRPLNDYNEDRPIKRPAKYDSYRPEPNRNHYAPRDNYDEKPSYEQHEPSKVHNYRQESSRPEKVESSTTVSNGSTDWKPIELTSRRNPSTQSVRPTMPSSPRFIDHQMSVSHDKAASSQIPIELPFNFEKSKYSPRFEMETPTS